MSLCYIVLLLYCSALWHPAQTTFWYQWQNRSDQEGGLKFIFPGSELKIAQFCTFRPQKWNSETTIYLFIVHTINWYQCLWPAYVVIICFLYSICLVMFHHWPVILGWWSTLALSPAHTPSFFTTQLLKTAQLSSLEQSKTLPLWCQSCIWKWRARKEERRATST